MVSLSEIQCEVVVIGGGPMGFAITNMLEKNLDKIYLWVPDIISYKKWRKEKIIKIFDYEFLISKKIEFITGYDFFSKNNLIIIFALPSRQFEEITEMIFANLNPQKRYDFILITKGFLEYHYRKKYNVYIFHQMILELIKKYNLDSNIALLAGPSLLHDIIHKNHIFFDIATNSLEFYEIIKTIFHQNFVHFSSQNDLFTSELLAILKNPVAILMGILSGIPKCGSSIQGELAAKCFKEILLLIKSLGGSEESVLSRAGISDFFATVFSPYSRNRNFGKQFTDKLLKGENKPSLFDQIQLFLTPSYYIEKEILSNQNLAEGGLAITPILEIAKEKNIELPLFKMLYNIFLRKNSPMDILSLLIDKEIQQSKIPVLRKKGKIEIVASGKMIGKALKERILKKVSMTPGLQQRIKRQSNHILSSLEKRLEKAKKQNIQRDIKNFKTEIELWTFLKNSKPEEEKFYIEKLIDFYIKNIVDFYIHPLRTFLIYFLIPFRWIIGTFQKGSVGPFVGGCIKEVKEIINQYPVFYAPTHRSHLDSVELAYALFFKGFPIPRAAAASILMTNPIWGAFLRSLGAYVVDRENTKNILYLEVLTQYTTMMLESGIPALAYPEGTRSRTGGFQPIKTGLLSTAIEAFRESGREIVIIPVTISHQWIPEDTVFTNQIKKIGFFTYVFKRSRVYFDFGKPILISHFIKLDDPTLEISKIILKEWKYHFKIQEHFILSKTLKEVNSFQKEEILRQIKKFIEYYPGNLVTKDINKIYKKGLRILKKRKLVEEKENGINILNYQLIEYYGNMIPEFSEEDLNYIKKIYEV